MPHALILPMQPLNAVLPPPEVGECAHAAFFALLAQADAGLAERLHANVERKPFTLSPLFRDRARPAEGSALRLTLLDQELLPAMLAGLLASQTESTIHLGGASFQITSVLTTRQAHPLAGSATYQSLREMPGRESLRVRFLTPTVFRSQKQDVLWPEPRLVWQSWIRAWCANAPAPETGFIDEERIVSLAETSVRVAQHRLQTRRIAFSKEWQPGFIGECEFDLRALLPSDRAILTALAEFAFYCGTGRKTGMGMGQTQLDPART
jgi:CRISPR-associated endoribonuclease Cas6